MIDITLIRKDPDSVRTNLEKRREPEKVAILDEAIEYDKAWRESVKKRDELRAKRNKVSKEIADLKKGKKDASDKIASMKKISEEIKELEAAAEDYQKNLKEALMRLPNLLHESVPYGKDDTENVEVRKWGKMPDFSFKPKNHLEILEGLGLIDSERAAKIAGTGFFYMKNELVLLDYALMRFGMDFLSKRDYTIIEPPYMMRRKPYEGVTDLAEFETVQYKIEGEDLRLISTSEHPMAAMYMDEVLLENELPVKLAGVSPCFRREIGAHGKYTRGLFRMHQFNKIEQFIFSHPEKSREHHEELQKNSEDMLQALGLPYRVVDICTGDIGIVAAKKYDADILMADGKYREVGSNSNCTDYQARRLNIKFRKAEGKSPEGFVHTLNNTGLATSRIMIGILEMNQQEDGSVLVPKVLQSYMGGLKKIEKRI